MLVRLTLSNGGLEIFVDSDIVKIVERNRDNPLETVITTIFLTPKGPASFLVKESPADVARLVNDACGAATSKSIIH